MSSSPKTISAIVSTHLSGQSRYYLEDIVNHGIHNLTNDYGSQDNEEYMAYQDEFLSQARLILDDWDIAAWLSVGRDV